MGRPGSGDRADHVRGERWRRAEGELEADQVGVRESGLWPGHDRAQPAMIDDDVQPLAQLGAMAMKGRELLLAAVGEGFLAVAGLCDRGAVADFLQQPPQPVACRGLVVNDQ